MVESGSEIVFNQMLFDRSLGAMRKGYFTAPVEGYWRFDMQLSLKMLSTEEFGLKYQYEIEVLHNNKVGNRPKKSSTSNAYYSYLLNYVVQEQISIGL